ARETRNLARLEPAAAGAAAGLAADELQPAHLLELRRVAERMRAAANEERARVVPDREALSYRPSESAGAQPKALAYTLGGDASADEEGEEGGAGPRRARLPALPAAAPQPRRREQREAAADRGALALVVPLVADDRAGGREQPDARDVGDDVPS